MSNRRAQWIDEITALPQRLRRRISGLSPQELVARPRAGEWSVAQNVHHLVDSHMNSYVRCKLMATESHPTFRLYDEGAWAELPDASDADIETSLRMLDALHTRWAYFWRTLPEEAWHRTGLHPEGETTVTLEDQLRIYVEHGEAHMEQIERTMRAGEQWPQIEEVEVDSESGTKGTSAPSIS